MPTHKKRSRILLVVLAVALLGASTVAVARRRSTPPAPVAIAFAEPRFGHPRPIPLSRPDAAPPVATNDGDAGPNAPQPIRNVAELDRYLDSLLLYAQYDPSVAGDVAEEAVGLMNGLVNELGGLESTLEKEREFTGKLQKIAQTPAVRPAAMPPEMAKLLSEMRATKDGNAQSALLAAYLDAMSRAAPDERGYWLEQLREANIEDHRAPAPPPELPPAP